MDSLITTTRIQAPQNRMYSSWNARRWMHDVDELKLAVIELQKIVTEQAAMIAQLKDMNTASDSDVEAPAPTNRKGKKSDNA